MVLAVSSGAFVVLVIAGGELLARRLAPDYLIKTRGLHVFSETYGWAGRPGAVAPMGGGRVSLNARGYRGRELTLPKTSGRTRVVVLGDSIAFGYGVSDEETFPHLLDARNEGIEVVNLGVEGYGPGQELLVLQRDGLPADPDVVVLAVCLRNDFVDAALSVALYDGVTPRPRFRLKGDDLVLDDTAVRRSGAGRALQWLSDQSHLFNRLSALVPRGEGEEDPGWRHRKQEVLRDQDSALRLTFALVMEMERTCRRQGIGFLVATFPNGLGYGIRPELAERFHESLRAEGVSVVEMGARFRALGLTANALAIDSTGHLGPNGHAVSAEILEGEIAARLGNAAARATEDTQG
jgi:GDSL-like Lipase/Acylhydrolase family